MNKTYNEKSISHFKGLEGVRMRPGMYIGGTDTSGFHHLVWEVLDNSIDEVLAGHANKIIVTLLKDGSVSIEDNGRGIPVGKHSSGKNTVELIFTELHAGGKFGQKDSAYHVAGGLHGVGAAVVNALSSKLEVSIWKDKKEHRIKFINGGKIEKPLRGKSSTRTETGTKVHFLPDKKVFGPLKLDSEKIKQRLMESAFLLKRLTIVYVNELENTSETFHYANNLLDYLEYLKKQEFISSPLILETKIDEVAIEAAIRYSPEHSSTIVSFVNNVKTISGGTHESGMISGMYKAISKAMKDMNISKRELERRDILEGMYAIISIRIPSTKLEFEGQTKTKLRSSFIRPLVEKAIYDEALNYFLKNKVQAESIMKKALLSAEAREASRKARDEVRNIKSKGKEKKILSGKLTPAQSSIRMSNELFVVEGDSAGGTAKLGRDKKHQAILPLRGKVLNSERSRLQDVLRNEELSTLMHSIGCGILDSCNPDKANYGKVIIMTDADTDGAHIQTLLLTFFYKYMKEMILEERIYLALPPLYKVKFKKQEEYLWSDEDLKKLRKKEGKLEIQRYKGLGEMNDDQLWETTMNPANRVLLKVIIETESSADDAVKVLMSDDAKSRRSWIERNVDFSIEDNFVELSQEQTDNMEEEDEN